MNDKEAIERMKDITNYIMKIQNIRTYGGYYIRCRSKEAKMFETVLNIIEKQQHIIEGKECVIETQAHNEEVLLEEIEKKDKQIDLMANNLIGVVFSDNDNKEILFDNKEDVKKYFEKKAEEE